MALVNKWPASTEQMYDNKQWEAKNWSIGEPITKEKLQKMDDGIAILATQVKAILGEFNPSSLDGAQLNASRLDKVQEWITGAADEEYEQDADSIMSRLGDTETTNDTQERALTAIKNELGGTFSDNNTTASFSKSYLNSALNEIYGASTPNTSSIIKSLIAELGATGTRSATGWTSSKLQTVISKATSVATEIWGSDTVTGDSKIDKLTTELYGSNITNYATATSRLDDLEKELCGPTVTRDTKNGGYSNSRLDRFDLDIAGQDERLTTLENELSGTNPGTTGSSRLDNMQNWITGSNSGSYESGKAAIMTRLNTDETDIGTLKTDNGTNKTNITNIINEIGGAYTSTGFSNSQISKIPSIIEANNTQDSNIGKIKIKVWGPGKDFDAKSRIDTLEDGLTDTDSKVAGHESRISRIETGAVAAKIFNYTTTNTTASDSLILSTNSLIDQNSIVMVFLNAATLGTNPLTIKDSTNTVYNIKIKVSSNPLDQFKAKFATGSLLGLYRGTSNEVYLFNAPLAI